jgi:hypothetical protein
MSGGMKSQFPLGSQRLVEHFGRNSHEGINRRRINTATNARDSLRLSYGSTCASLVLPHYRRFISSDGLALRLLLLLPQWQRLLEKPLNMLLLKPCISHAGCG